MELRPQLAVEEPPARRRGADGEPADVVSLAFTSPTLGRLDLRLELRGERLLAEVTTPAGRPHVVASGPLSVYVPTWKRSVWRPR